MAIRIVVIHGMTSYYLSYYLSYYFYLLLLLYIYINMAMDQNRGIPSEPQNSWQIDVHPTKIDSNRF